MQKEVSPLLDDHHGGVTLDAAELALFKTPETKTGCAALSVGAKVAIGVSVVVALVLVSVGIAAGAGAFKESPPPPPALNVIMMISDGFGPSGETLARAFANKAALLPLDKRIIGSSITYSANAIVTDSAAGATAYSCATKTYNYAVAVLENLQPCPTILEAAQRRGLATGLVVTSRITHATPAAYSAHALNREQEWLIAEQQITQGIDVMIGGGLCEFQPNSGSTAGLSCRPDSRDVLASAVAAGYQIVTNLTEFNGPMRLPVLGLLAESHMDFEIDRDPNVQPALVNTTRKALELLSGSAKGAEKGFFLLIEGSRIDHAGHNNDPAAHVREVAAYQETFAAVLEFAAAHGNTIVVSTSDHETGGLTLARTVYTNGTASYPYTYLTSVLAAASHSCEYLAGLLRSNAALDTAQTVASGLGITDMTASEIAAIDAARANVADFYGLTYALSNLISYRARIGWTTHGHTGQDVNLYAFGPGTETIRGVNQNTAIGQFLVDALGLSLEAIAAEVRAKFANLPPYNATSWPNDGEGRRDADPRIGTAEQQAAREAVREHGHN